MRLVLISAQIYMLRRGRYVNQLLYKPTFGLVTIDVYMLGRRRHS